MKKHESGGFIHSDDGKVGDEDTHTENYNILWDVPWRDSLEASVGSNLLSLGVGWVEEGAGELFNFESSPSLFPDLKSADTTSY